MDPLEDIYPPFALRIRCGELELRHVRESDLPAIVELVRGGIYDPAVLPFLTRWAEAGDELARNTLQFYWSAFAASGPDAWHMVLAVRHRGTLVGVQDVTALHFATLRSLDTGSWLGREHQGRGIGTLMRQAVCAFGFDVLAAEQMTSAYMAGNRASEGVSRKLGYRPNGVNRLAHPDDGSVRIEERVLLLPSDFVRPAEPVEVDAPRALLHFLGAG